MTIVTLPIPEPPDWSAIMQAHKGWLASVVYARLRDPHAVEEVLQETALAASRQQLVANDDEGVCKWLYRVAIRQALLYRRNGFRNMTKLHSSVHASGNPVANHNDDPYRILVASEQREQVQAAIEKLASRDYQVLMLKYRDGWSCREMAHRLGSTESSMKSRLLRARNNLRCELLKVCEHWETL